MSVALYEKVLTEFQCYLGDPVATIKRALEESTAFVMGHCFKAHLYLSGMEPGPIPAASAALQAASVLPATDAARRHLGAARELIGGEYGRASEAFEDILVEHPRDVLALQMAHLFDFYRGDARNLRDRVARVLHGWGGSVPGYHAVLGMYAFGLEECANYARAQEMGRRATEFQPKDAWAHHAVAHVMEMQGRREEGIDWMSSREDAWAVNSSFSIHNGWHWDPFLLDLDRTDEVLKMYDGPIRQARSDVMLDMIDASALLWCLDLRGVDLGGRWDELADAWAPRASDGFYCFNDAHAMMAFVGAGRRDLVESVLDAQKARLGSGGSNQTMTREVGLPVCEALAAFGQKDNRTAVEQLRRVRGIMNRFGGIHAQRDIFDLTLIEAAVRDRQIGLVKALASERAEMKPPEALTTRYISAAAE